MKVVLGIDPGASTGLAIYVDGQLVRMETVKPLHMERVIRREAPGHVVFEDSRLQTHAWTAQSKASRGAALATARSLGQVDAWCRLVTEICAELGVPARGISPAGKGKKIDHEPFVRITGWKGKSNQHCRDAAMVAWRYRNVALA